MIANIAIALVHMKKLSTKKARLGIKITWGYVMSRRFYLFSVRGRLFKCPDRIAFKIIPEFSEVNGRVFVENWRKRDIAIAVFVGHTPSIAAYRYLSVWHKIEEVKELPAVKNMTAREARGALFNVSGKHADALRKMLFYVEDQDLELPDLVQHCVDDVLHSGVYRFSPTQLLDCLF